MQHESGVKSDFRPINITSVEAWDLLRKDAQAYLIDVRTKEEWIFTGYPDLSAQKLVMLSWRLYPDMVQAPKFIETLKNLMPDSRNSKLLFLCRSGQRSEEAALKAIEEGYKLSFNIVDGFEGPLNSAVHRNEIDGWKYNGLPWRQN